MTVFRNEIAANFHSFKLKLAVRDLVKLVNCVPELKRGGKETVRSEKEGRQARRIRGGAHYIIPKCFLLKIRESKIP